MARTVAAAQTGVRPGNSNDFSFAAAIVLILAALLLPLPPILIDLGLAISMAASVLILMVALWINKPLEFSSFPTILLVCTMLRLSLNVATTRLILSNGSEGHVAAGHVIAGFADIMMGGDFLIGVIVFLILLTVNFMVITKGATRIAEVGARFALDAVPGKQMAIDADLSAGTIDEEEARRRRRELEEESAFYGAMDGASKFVRGDAIAGLIITAVNLVGGLAIGTLRHGMTFSQAGEIYTKLSVGDGLVTQIPALIVALASGLLVAKGGNRGSADKAVFAQLGAYPKALHVAGAVMLMLALAPGLPFLIFAPLSAVFFALALAIPKRERSARDLEEKAEQQRAIQMESQAKASVAGSLYTPEIELCLGKQLAAALIPRHGEIAQRMSNLRKRFARQSGVIVPEIKLSDDITCPHDQYRIKIHGTTVGGFAIRIGDVLVVTGGKRLDVPSEPTTEPAFGLQAVWISEVHGATARRAGFTPVDSLSIILTHVKEIIAGNLAQLLSYRSLRHLIDRLEPEYKKLVEEIVPAHMSYSGLQAVLKLLLAERVSIRSLPLVLEAIAEFAPHARKPEQIAEHVRGRLAQQICGDIAEDGTLRIVRLSPKWETEFQRSLRRDARGEIVEFDLDTRSIEQFCLDASSMIRKVMEEPGSFAIVATPEIRPYVRMFIERLFPAVPILSHMEISRTVQIKLVGLIGAA
jgi:flagellar biosynthesis protein FlhA